MLWLARNLATRVATGLPYNDDFMDSFEDSHFHYWGAVVSNYTSRDLTKESDRLLAMPGISKAFREITGDRYLAGLWETTVLRDLPWESKASKGVQARRIESSCIPSWSWASVVGGQVQLWTDRHYGVQAFRPHPLIRFVEARIMPEPPGGDPTGLLRSAELDIECMLYYYRWVGQSEKLTIYTTDEVRAEDYFEHGKADTRYLQLDTTDLVERFGVADKIEGVCIPASEMYEGRGAGTNEFLMLERESDNRFRRIGILSTSGFGTRYIDKWSGEVSCITLI